MRLSEDALGGLEGGDAHLWRRLLTQRTATFETVLEDSVRRDDGDTAGTMLWNLRRVLVEGFYSDADRWVSRALTCSERTPTTEGKLLVLAACFRAKRGYRAGAWRFAKRGLTLLTLRPWDRIEALSLLPPNLASLVPAEPGEAASDAV